LELVKGPPALRRAHLDQLSAALWPGRVDIRPRYAQVLGQRNALIARIRTGRASRASLSSWNMQLASCGIELMNQRAAAVEAVCDAVPRLAVQLGLDLGLEVIYRPRSMAHGTEQLAQELSERVDQDVERGYTAHGPHRHQLLLALVQ